MKVLQVSLKPPYPKVDGGCVAIAAMTESLISAGAEVKLLTMETTKHPFIAEKLPISLSKATSVESVFIDTSIKPIHALVNLFGSSSYNIDRFYSKDFEVKLRGILEKSEYDIIHLESVFCTPYLDVLRENSSAKVVVRTHNVEFKIWELLAKNELNPVKKWYLGILAKRLKNYEVSVLKKVDGILAITQEDEQNFNVLGIETLSEVIPIGIDVKKIETAQLDDSLSLYHLGAMDWAPNVEGVEWFLDRVWPVVSNEIPEATAHFAGRKMPASLLSRSNGNLKIEGEVEDASKFISGKNIAVIPVLSGSGMRVKIIEALAHGKVVITTSLGATGINYTEGVNLLIANTPKEFAKKLAQLRDDSSMIARIGNEARLLAEREHNLQSFSSKLTYFYGKL